MDKVQAEKEYQRSLDKKEKEYFSLVEQYNKNDDETLKSAMTVYTIFFPLVSYIMLNYKFTGCLDKVLFSIVILLTAISLSVSILLWYLRGAYLSSHIRFKGLLAELNTRNCDPDDEDSVRKSINFHDKRIDKLGWIVRKLKFLPLIAFLISILIITFLVMKSVYLK
jgi:hypothetical protein